jgi:Thrombospondin type 3 repeat
MYLVEVASRHAVVNVPEILRGGRITDVDKKINELKNETTWGVTIKRTLNEDLPSLYTSASFCSGPLAHVDDPVHASRLYSLDGQVQPEGERDKRGQPLRFNDLRIGDNLTISGQVQGHILKPELEIRLRGGQPRVLATFDTDLTFSAEARATADWDDAKEAFLYKLCFPVANFPAGAITINLNLQLEQKVGFEGKLSAEAVMGVQKRFHSRSVVGYDGRLTGDARFFSDSEDLSPPMDFTPPQLTDRTQASGRIFTRVRPTLRMGAAYPDCETGIGVYADLKAYGSLDVTPTQTPWWTLGAGLTLQAGLNISAWGLEVANWVTEPETLVSAQTRDSSGSALLPSRRGPGGALRPGLPRSAASGALQSGADQRWAVAIDDLDTVGGFTVTSVAPTADEGLVVVSHEVIGGRSRLMRLDRHGALLWSKRYASTLTVKKVLVLPDASILVAGSPNWLARHDANGNEIRNIVIQVAAAGSSQFAGCNIKDAALLATPAGSYDVIMVGDTVNDTVPRACAQRVDANGNLVWAKGYDGINLQRFNAVVAASDGRIAVAGRWDGITSVPPFGNLTKPAAFIGKLDATTGQVVWGKRLSDTLYRGGEFFDLAEGADGTLFAVGNLLGIVTQEGGALLARIAADGTDARHALLTHDFDWEAELAYETPAPLNISYFDLYDSMYAITPMADGFAVAGRTRLGTADQGEGAWLLKLNAQLGVEWFSTLEGAFNDSWDAIAYAGDSVLVTGWSASLAGLGQPAGDSWLVVAKYPVNGRLQLLPELQGLNVRYLQPGVRDSGNDPLVANPGVVLDADIGVQALEVRSVTALATVFTSPSRLCVKKMTATGAVSTADACGADADADSIDDVADNCLNTANANQRDTNGDGYGNLCDGDLDNNGIVNTLDLSVLRAAFGKQAANLDADLNGDGVVNTSDLAIFKSLFGKPPGPSGLH